jgi:hypothetical protein
MSTQGPRGSPPSPNHSCRSSPPRRYDRHCHGCCLYSRENSHQPIPSTYGLPPPTVHGPYASHKPLLPRMKPATLPVPPTGSYLYPGNVPAQHRTAYADRTGQNRPQRASENAPPAAYKSKHVDRPASTRYDVDSNNRPRLTTKVDNDTVRISGLPYEYKKSQIAEMLKRYGEAEISSYRAEDRARTTTIVATFKSSCGAAKAIRALDGFRLGGQVLDAELTARPIPTVVRRTSSTKSKKASGNRSSATAKGPLVVNGAMSIRPRYHRRGRRSPPDSDSEDDDSDEDSDGSRTTSGRTSRRPSCY